MRKIGWRLMAQPLEGRGKRISELESVLIYRASSRIDRVTHRNPVFGVGGG